MSDLYDNSSTLTGDLVPGKTVSFKRVLRPGQRLALLGFGLAILASSTAFLWYVITTLSGNQFNPLLLISLVLIVLLEVIRLLQSLTLVCFAFAAKDPIPLKPRTDLRVAVLTTIVPSKEPFPLVAHTLHAMKNLQVAPGTKLHVWLLDEGNDPAIRARCKLMGVNYFSRKDLDGWNTDTGAYKARTKHGNHNAWRRAHEYKYDIVAQMDPDHVPRPDFLERTLGYFNDPVIGFVVAPQVYGNSESSWIARAAAFQAYVFHGIIQRGGNGLGAPLLIGTNHLYRTAAFRQINGYQDSIIEDHLTSMVMIGAKRPDGSHWKGVYTPDIVAVGEGPTTFTDFFNQQKRWAYGIWEIATKSTRTHIKKMTHRQAWTFMMLQFFYPSVAVSWVLSSLATLLFCFNHVQYHGVPAVAALLWSYTLITSLSLFFWLRRFNLVPYERVSWGLGGMGLLLMCIPVYVSAAWQALCRRPLTYTVTAKGSRASHDSLLTFRPHLVWLGLNVAILLATTLDGDSLLGSTDTWWVVEHMAICVTPLVIYGFYRLSQHLQLLRHSFTDLQPTLPLPGDLLPSLNGRTHHE